MWYEGLPGFRQMNMILQGLEVIRIGLLFPFFSMAYIICPWIGFSQKLRKPFIKFICTSASYFTFLCKIPSESTGLSYHYSSFISQVVYLLELAKFWVLFFTEANPYCKTLPAAVVADLYFYSRARAPAQYATDHWQKAFGSLFTLYFTHHTLGQNVNFCQIIHLFTVRSLRQLFVY